MVSLPYSQYILLCMVAVMGDSACTMDVPPFYVHFGLVIILSLFSLSLERMLLYAAGMDLINRQSIKNYSKLHILKTTKTKRPMYHRSISSLIVYSSVSLFLVLLVVLVILSCPLSWSGLGLGISKRRKVCLYFRISSYSVISLVRKVNLRILYVSISLRRNTVGSSVV